MYIQFCEVTAEKSSNPKVTRLSHFQAWSSQDFHYFGEFTFFPPSPDFLPCYSKSILPSVLMVLNRQGRRTYPDFLWLCPQSQRPDGQFQAEWFLCLNGKHTEQVSTKANLLHCSSLLRQSSELSTKSIPAPPDPSERETFVTPQCLVKRHGIVKYSKFINQPLPSQRIQDGWTAKSWAQLIDMQPILLCRVSRVHILGVQVRWCKIICIRSLPLAGWL